VLAVPAEDAIQELEEAKQGDDVDAVGDEESPIEAALRRENEEQAAEIRYLEVRVRQFLLVAAAAAAIRQQYILRWLNLKRSSRLLSKGKRWRRRELLPSNHRPQPTKPPLQPPQ
jgi:hypothetical protein